MVAQGKSPLGGGDGSDGENGKIVDPGGQLDTPQEPYIPNDPTNPPEIISNDPSFDAKPTTISWGVILMFVLAGILVWYFVFRK